MRHGKTINHLGRTKPHRVAMTANIAASLINSEKKRIITTHAKAKALRRFLEPLVTRAKNNTTHNRRTVFSYIPDKKAVTVLFTEIAGKVADRPGGYLRILKLGPRKSDNTEMALIEFVDFNQFIEASPKKKKATKRRAAKKSTSATPAKKATKAKSKKAEEKEENTDGGEE